MAAPAMTTRMYPLASPELRAASVALAVGLCAVLLGAVLAFGAVDMWAVSALELAIAALSAAWLIGRCLRAQATTSYRALYLPVAGFAAVGAVQVVFNLTANRFASFTMLLQYLACAAALFLGAQAVRDARSARLVLLACGCFGALVAVFAIAQDLAGNGKLYWVWPVRWGNSFGMYANRDHFAGMMELLTPCMLVLTLGRLVSAEKRFLAGFATVLMASSIVLSRSRGGIISLLVELGFAVWIASIAQRRRGIGAWLALVVGGLLALVLWMGSSALWEHISDLHDSTRVAIMRDGVRMFAAKPVLGWGLGAFPTAYPPHRSFASPYFINAVHNDYLQVLIETGLLGGLCGAWFLLALYRDGTQDLRRWTSNWGPALQAGSLIGCTGMLVHTFFDFNLQIPANAALFFAFSAFATAKDTGPGAGSDRKWKKRKRTRERSESMPGLQRPAG